MQKLSFYKYPVSFHFKRTLLCALVWHDILIPFVPSLNDIAACFTDKDFINLSSLILLKEHKTIYINPECIISKQSNWQQIKEFFMMRS